MKKRLLSLVLTATLAGTLLSGCASAPKEAEKPAEKVTLTYVNWNLGAAEDDNLERRMIKAWNEANPNIQVQIDESMDYSKYGDSLTAAASAGKLPDVFALPNIPFGLQNEWLADVTGQSSKDEDWNKIPKPIEQAVHYGKGIYAVPSGMFLSGYWVNDDLFQAANVDELGFNPTLEEFKAAVKATTKPAENILGLSESLQIPEWYPAAVNKDYGWFTFDGSKYNLDSPEFKDGIKLANEVLTNKYTFDALTEDQKAKLNAKWHGDVWNQGKVAIRWDGSWVTTDFSKLNFKSRFIGTPGGRATIIGDYLGISKSSKSVDAAYKFAKYMSFGKDGILKRIELGSKDNSFNSLPLSTDKEVLDKYFEMNKFEGLKEAFEDINNDVVEGVKFVPGYVKSRWEAQTGVKIGDKDNANIGDVVSNAITGKVKIEDYASQLNKLANDEYQKAVESMKALTDK